MKHIEVDLNAKVGIIKPMHAVNNGPIPGQDMRGQGNMWLYREAGFPYIRNHDASYFSVYGNNHVVDVDFIFTDFDADENDPANYDFAYTDAYCKAVYDAGASLVYRLGTRIEHGFKKYNTIPPRDYHKWARICEHIIRHYVYGWADGMHLDITYWEIWNEADGINPDGVSACWQGTHEEFYEFYHVVATYLKGKFPDLKIGGPAYTCAHPGKKELDDFLAYVQEHKTPLDFFSWHGYTIDPKYISDNARYVRKLLDAYGQNQAEMHLNEWNYVSCWVGQEYIDCLRTFPTNRGAAFCAACMLEAQHSPMDMFMYFDTTPGHCFNGMFDYIDYKKPMKTYYVFWQFNKLYRLENEVATCSDCPDLYVAAAAKDNRAAVQMVYYSPQEIENDTVEIWLRGLKGKTMITCLLVDEEHDNEPVRKEIVTSEECALYLHVKNNNTILLQIEPLE